MPRYDPYIQEQIRQQALKEGRSTTNMHRVLLLRALRSTEAEIGAQTPEYNSGEGDRVTIAFRPAFTLALKSLPRFKIDRHEP